MTIVRHTLFAAALAGAFALTACSDDGGSDTTPDVGADTSTDTGSTDAGGEDVSTDATDDAGADVLDDADDDATADAGVDAVTDAATDAGFALGFCDFEGICAEICDADADCETPGDTCQRFLPPEGLGFCGTNPEDG